MRCAFYGEEYLSKDDVIDILGIEFPICKSCARYYGLHSPKELLDVLEHSDYANKDDVALLRGRVAEEQRKAKYLKIKCLRCDIPLAYLGEREFQNGRHKLMGGDLSHLLEGSTNMHMAYCEKCSKIEFFLNKPENIE